MVEVSYAADFNLPDNELWHSKTTMRRVNRFAPNLILGSMSEEPATDSRWGLEFGVHLAGVTGNASLSTMPVSPWPPLARLSD